MGGDVLRRGAHLRPLNNEPAHQRCHRHRQTTDLAVRAILLRVGTTAALHDTSSRDVHSRLPTRWSIALESVRPVPSGNPLDYEFPGPAHDQREYAAMESALAGAQRGKPGSVATCGDPNRDDGYTWPRWSNAGSTDLSVTRPSRRPVCCARDWRRHRDQQRRDQGFASIFTRPQDRALVGRHGSDCGIANVKIGTSGAETAARSAGKGNGGGRDRSAAWKGSGDARQNHGDFSPRCRLPREYG